MRSLVKDLFILLIIGVTAAFFAQGSLAQVEQTVKEEMSPCDYPLHYYLASVDPKFNLSQDEILADMKQAVSTWNKAAGKDLFVYDPKGTLPVYFVYDKRQALNSQIGQMQNKLNTNAAQLDKQMADFTKQRQDFETRLKAYNDEVQSWNDKGGAPEDVYNQLQKEGQQLKEESVQLNEQARSLNLQAKSYNVQVGDLNSTINSFNEVLGNQPEEGIYIEEKTNIFDPGNKKIEIYFVPSKDELIHTLTHEFGHALHIDHNSNPKSIMYAYTSKSLDLSKEDLSSLKDACQTKTLSQVLQDKGSLIAENYQRLLGNLTH